MSGKFYLEKLVEQVFVCFHPEELTMTICTCGKRDMVYQLGDLDALRTEYQRFKHAGYFEFDLFSERMIREEDEEYIAQVQSDFEEDSDITPREDEVPSWEDEIDTDIDVEEEVCELETTEGDYRCVSYEYNIMEALNDDPSHDEIGAESWAGGATDWYSLGREL